MKVAWRAGGGGLEGYQSIYDNVSNGLEYFAQLEENSFCGRVFGKSANLTNPGSSLERAFQLR